MLMRLVDTIIEIFIVLVIVHAIGSWFPQIRESRFYYYVDKVVEPVLRPIRNVIPPIGGVDISPVILIIILAVIQRII